MILQLADNPNPHLKNMALDALDQSISAVLGSEQFEDYKQSKSLETSQEVRPSTIFIAKNPYFIHSKIYNVSQ